MLTGWLILLSLLSTSNQLGSMTPHMSFEVVFLAFKPFDALFLVKPLCKSAGVRDYKAGV
jgi:hypothetical protein